MNVGADRRASAGISCPSGVLSVKSNSPASVAVLGLHAALPEQPRSSSVAADTVTAAGNPRRIRDSTKEGAPVQPEPLRDGGHDEQPRSPRAS